MHIRTAIAGIAPVVGLFAAAVFLYGCGAETGGEGVMYSYKMMTDAATGWNIVELRANRADDPSRSLAVRITPQGGNNMYSFTIGGRELLYGPESLDTLFKTFLGTPILYPTPNRVRNATYTFRGKEYHMGYPGEERSHWIHGLVRDDTAWAFDEPSVARDGVSFTARYVLDEDNPRFAAYPFPNILEVTYTLTADRVRIGYRVENTGKDFLGFGFALHPYFRVPVSKDDTIIQVAVPEHMIATEDRFPTGVVEPVAGTPFDLREPRLLSELRLDDVYIGATPDTPIRFTHQSLGLTLQLKATGDFTHAVVYTPDRDFFCIENQTCSTDAHNLHSQGLVREAHLKVLAPGETAEGHVEYIVTVD